MQTIPAPPSPVVTEPDAARYIGMSAAFLRRARMTGRTKSSSEGPPFVRIPGGRGIRYRIVDLDAWLAANVYRAGSPAGPEIGPENPGPEAK